MEQIPERLDLLEVEVAGFSPDTSHGPSVLELVDATGSAHPHRVTVDDGRCRLSPFLLGVTVRRLARAISDLAPAGPVGIALREGTLGIVAVLAVAAAGRDAVLLDPTGLPEAARGCACLVSDPGDGAIPPFGCVGIDVYLSCSATYAEARLALPGVAVSAIAIRFGTADGEAFTLERLIAGMGTARLPHPPASGLLSCPACLGGALAALVAGGEIRFGANDDRG